MNLKKTILKITVPDDSHRERGQMQLDLSKLGLKVHDKPVTMTKPNWWLLVDVYSETPFSTFHESKDKMVEPTCEQLNKFIQFGHKVKVIRCDNAGENNKLEEACKSKEW